MGRSFIHFRSRRTAAMTGAGTFCVFAIALSVQFWLPPLSATRVTAWTAGLLIGLCLSWVFSRWTSTTADVSDPADRRPRPTTAQWAVFAGVMLMLAMPSRSSALVAHPLLGPAYAGVLSAISLSFAVWFLRKLGETHDNDLERSRRSA
jgi:hypothetical protein